MRFNFGGFKLGFHIRFFQGKVIVLRSGFKCGLEAKVRFQMVDNSRGLKGAFEVNVKVFLQISVRLPNVLNLG